ncbi:MAG: hypothetical protein JNL11_17425 [Bdellovibrionaceae bacterium]|nr:hypothetical protein [Pseudobdellovibrionaceae bacterium]
MGLRVDHYNKTTELYEVYVTHKMANGDDIDVECFTCDCNGKIEKHEIWSELFDEYRPAVIARAEVKFFPGIFERIGKQLAEAIREYNLDESNFEEPWKMIKPTIGSQL